MQIVRRVLKQCHSVVFPGGTSELFTTGANDKTLADTWDYVTLAAGKP
jgi:hypothetical protein